MILRLHLGHRTRFQEIIAVSFGVLSHHGSFWMEENGYVQMHNRKSTAMDEPDEAPYLAAVGQGFGNVHREHLKITMVRNVRASQGRCFQSSRRQVEAYDYIC